MKKKQWFILNENQVNGPYEEQEIEGLLQSAAKPLIWGRGLAEWVPPIQWRETLKDPAFNISATEIEPLWKYRVEDREHGPLPYSEFILALKKQTDFAKVQVQGEGHANWTEIYLVPKVADELGISRRAHARVPIMGTFKCETPKGPLVTKVISVSEGGMGLGDAGPLKIGEKYKGVFTSPNLYVSINCIIEVMYVGSEGYAGVHFVNLPIEAKSAVIEYINKFKDLPK